MARKISVTENNRIGTSYMYSNENINPKHHVHKPTNNNQTKERRNYYNRSIFYNKFKN